MNGFSRRQWLLALAIAVLIHGGVAYVVLRSPPDAGSIATGAGGISVALGPAGRAPGSIETEPPPTAEEIADPVEELAEVTPDDQPPEEAPAEDVEDIEAMEAGETVEAEVLQDVDPETPDEATTEELKPVAAEPLKPNADPVTEEITPEELETIEAETTRQVNIPNEPLSVTPPSTAETLISETRPDDQLLEQPESVAPDEVSTAAIAEAANPEPIDVRLTPQQDADELAVLPSEPPVIDEAWEVDVTEVATTLPEPTPSTPDETVAESQNSSIPETTDIPPEALDEATPELAEAADVIPEQVAARLPDPETVAEPVLPSPRKPPPSEQTTPDPPAEEVTTEPAQLAGAGGEAGTLDDGDLGSGQNATGGGAVGARADYFAVLQAWLEQHKVYPRGALTRRLEGVVSLRFIIDREGRVLDYNIEKSSGHRLLDRAISALIERAQPLPTMPDDIKETNLTLVVPISFVLK